LPDVHHRNLDQAQRAALASIERKSVGENRCVSPPESLNADAGAAKQCIRGLHKETRCAVQHPREVVRHRDEPLFQHLAVHNLYLERLIGILSGQRRHERAGNQRRRAPAEPSADLGDVHRDPQREPSLGCPVTHTWLEMDVTTSYFTTNPPRARFPAFEFPARRVPGTDSDQRPLERPGELRSGGRTSHVPSASLVGLDDAVERRPDARGHLGLAHVIEKQAGRE